MAAASHYNFLLQITFVTALLNLPLTSTAGNNPELLLTPWWNMELAEGEMFEVDCGVEKNLLTNVSSLQWLNGTQTLATNNSVQVTDSGSSNAYYVLTVNIARVTLQDTQLYTCQMINGTAWTSRSINLTVVPTGISRWNFEKKVRTGGINPWNTEVTLDDYGAMWKIRDGSEKDVITRNTGPKFDHTYGPSKHIGHFLEVSSTDVIVTPAVAFFSSDWTTSNEDTEQCLEFWYSQSGIHTNLSVELDTNTTNMSIWAAPEGSQVTWTKAQVNIPRQTSAYQLRIKAEVCLGENQETTDQCPNEVIAIDDIKIHQSDCKSVSYQWPNVDLKYTLANDGLLVLLHEGQYGTVCFTEFGTTEKSVICHGITLNSTEVENPPAPPSTSTLKDLVIWLSGLSCENPSEKLDSCISTMWGVVGVCTHDEDVKVKCEDTEKSSTSSSTGSIMKTSTAVVSSTKMLSTRLSTTTIRSTNGTTRATASVTASSTQRPSTVQSTSISTTVADDDEESGIMTHPVSRWGKGIVIVLIVVVVISLAVFTTLIYKGRKRRRRKNNYLNFGTTNYSREHLPTNEFHLESPLTMSSMGYTVLA